MDCLMWPGGGLQDIADGFNGLLSYTFNVGKYTHCNLQYINPLKRSS